MSMPGVQMPHWAPPVSRNAPAADRAPSVPGRRSRPSTVRHRPHAGRHRPGRPGRGRNRPARRRRSTVHAPHSPSPQPSFVPVSARSSRRTSSSRRMPGTSTLDRRAVDGQSIGRRASPARRRLGGHRVRPAAGSESPGRRPAIAGLTREAREDPFRASPAGRRSRPRSRRAMAATTAGAPTSIGSSPTPFAPCGTPVNGASTRIVEMRGASRAVGMM